MNSSLIFRIGLFAILLAACGESALPITATPGTAVSFDLSADLQNEDHFYAFPYPSDLRLTEAGRPDLAGYPNPKDIVMVTDLLSLAADRKGFPVLGSAYFAFDQPLAEQDPDRVIAAESTSPILLVDVDPESPERGRLIPTVAATLEADPYTSENLLAVAPRPGFVLHGNRTYAVVVMRSLNDADGKPLGIALPLAQLAGGMQPAGPNGAAVAELYRPLWETLGEIQVPAREVAAATVFTTGDQVVETYALANQVLDQYSISVDGLRFEANHDGFCELHASVEYPQFQRGTPPFDKVNDNGDVVPGAGVFEFSEDGTLIQQGTEEAPIVITIPFEGATNGAYPLVMYYHGSGGDSDQAVHRGPKLEESPDVETPGEGPAYVLAKRGFATVTSALPVNPERLPGADMIAYLNLNNVTAFRDTFRQGVIEQRLLIKALETLQMDAAVLGNCDTAAPAPSTSGFSPDGVLAMGQSMGGMYTNMIGAVEPRIKAVVPTGAGGFWNYFILETSLIENAGPLLGLMVGTQAELTFMHPVMNLVQTAWEGAEPIVYVPRLSRFPLPGHPARSVYQPAGYGDSFFPPVIYDAMTLAYGHEQAGDEIWPGMQDALQLSNLSGFVEYPVSQNLVSEGAGEPYTGVVVQYEGDGWSDPHGIYAQLDAVKYQFGCFFRTFQDTGKARVLAPREGDGPSLDTPCAAE